MATILVNPVPKSYIKGRNYWRDTPPGAGGGTAPPTTGQLWPRGNNA